MDETTMSLHMSRMMAAVPSLGQIWRSYLTSDTHRIYAIVMTKKLVQHGNSAALIIDKPILDLLNLSMDTPLEITTDGRNIVISPAASHTEDEFLASLDRINSRFSTTLERLAK
jgi:antitoxin component of MazEF toxin-antitoxin module